MALPSNVLSTDTAHDEFEFPRSVWKIPLVDYEIGGTALGDTSQGLKFKLWKAFVDGDGTQIKLQPDGGSASVIVTDTDITEISLAFDQQMRAYLTWMAGSSAKYRWFDSTVSNFVTTTLPVGTTTPRMCLDDKRTTSTGTSDVILAYMRAGALMYRQQRDRFLTERQLEGYLEGAELIQIGMNLGNRFQFQVKP